MGRFGKIWGTVLFTLFAFLLLGRVDGATIDGELTVRVADHFEEGRSEISYWLEDSKTKETIEVHFNGPPPVPLHTGQRLRVTGEKYGNEVLASDEAGALTLLPVMQAAAAAEAATIGVRKAVVLLVNFSDLSVSCSTGQVASTMYTGAQSVNALYQEASFGLLSFNPDANGDGLPDVFGPFTINYSSGTCNPNGWADAADTAASANGVNLSLYQHRMYVLPSAGACSWAGLGDIGCGTFCRTWIPFCTWSDVYAHELGHNLGMRHSSNDTNNDGANDCEYCDTSDIMGYSNVGWRQFNAPHKEQMGWIAAPPVLTVSGNGSFSVAPLETDPSLTVLPLALKIFKPNSSDYYYFSYRRALGYDASLGSQYVDRCNVHHYAGGNNNTFFITTLTDGQSFQDPANGITVRQISHNSGAVNLDVTFGCITNAPALTVTPGTRSAWPGTAVSYIVNLTNKDTPQCGGGTTFNLTPILPAGWTAMLSTNAFTLAANATGQATLTVTSPASATTGNYTLGVTVSDGVIPAHTVSAIVTNVVSFTPAFILDGAADSPNYLLSSPGMTIYAALRGQILYVATWSPGNYAGDTSKGDHFIFVTDQLLPTASGPAPWAKAGTVAVASSKPFIGGESQTDYVGWFNAPGSAQVVKAPVNSAQMEGTIDLVAAFGSMPSNVYVCAAAYATQDGGVLTSQAPAGNNNGNIEPNEFLAIPVITILDRNGDGLYDRLDPALDFVVTRVKPAPGGGCTLTWNAQPGKTYQLLYSNGLGAAWQNLGSPITAAAGVLTLSQTDGTAPFNSPRFYRVKVAAP